MSTRKLAVMVLVLVALGCIVSPAAGDLMLPYYGQVLEEGSALWISNAYAGTGLSYGARFYTAGVEGRGILGQSAGSDGRGVQGYASNQEDVKNYGGYFTASGRQGVGIRAKGGPNGCAGEFEGDVKIAGSGSGIVFPDGTRQTSAGGGGGGSSFTLPYAGQASPLRAAFSVTNTNTSQMVPTGGIPRCAGYFSALGGTGVVAEGTSVGITGKASASQSDRSVGVYGESGKGMGVYGKSTTGGHGVKGEAMAGGCAVYGVAGGTGAVEPHYGGCFEGQGQYGCGVLAKSGAHGYAGDFHGPVVIRSRLGVEVMELGEGLDYAEGFDVSDTSAAPAGTVLVIDPEHPGKLRASGEAYDTKVAGIAAGARGLGSGVRLGGDGFDCDVALAGRVYCNVDATRAGIEPGDLLTTSSIPGHAMKVRDHLLAQGAILGKAMEKLEKGEKGQILVLVTLQ